MDIICIAEMVSLVELNDTQFYDLQTLHFSPHGKHSTYQNKLPTFHF